MEIIATYTRLEPSTSGISFDLSIENIADYIDGRRKFKSLHKLGEHLKPFLEDAIKNRIDLSLIDSKDTFFESTIKILNLKQILINCSSFIKEARNSCCIKYSTNSEFDYCPKCGKLL